MNSFTALDFETANGYRYSICQVGLVRVANGIRIEKGMSVEVVSSYGNPVSTNGGHQVIEAFERKYGIDIKRAGALNGSLLQVEKL